MGSRRVDRGTPSVRDSDSTAGSTWTVRDSAGGDPDASRSVRTFRTPTLNAPSTTGRKYSTVVEESLSSSSLVPPLAVVEAPGWRSARSAVCPAP